MATTAERLQAEQLSSVSTAFLQLRPKLLAPVGPVLLWLLIQSGAPLSQVSCIATTFLATLTGFTWEAWHVRKHPPSPASLCLSLQLTLGGLALLCGFSGGPRSPFVPILFAPLGIAFAAFGSARQTVGVLYTFGVVLAYLIASLWLWPWPPLPERIAAVIATVSAVLSTTLLLLGVTGLAKAYRTVAQLLERARRDVVDTTQHHAEQLEQVGAQVAHELKNPLASIKALVQLLHAGAKSSDTARSEQRLAVVLSEVDRMQAILHDYLNFSRPLSPLHLAEHGLRPFLQELLQLLEVEATKHEVRLELACPEVVVPFDAPKLRQALLNLAQNAARLLGTTRTTLIDKMKRLGLVAPTPR